VKKASYVVVNKWNKAVVLLIMVYAADNLKDKFLLICGVVIKIQCAVKQD
jgi:hypothetical protein